VRGGGRGGGGACGGGTGKRIAERDHRYVRLFPRWKKGRWAVRLTAIGVRGTDIFGSGWRSRARLAQAKSELWVV